MQSPFSKWDIVYATKFPESLSCQCGRVFTVADPQLCPDCGSPVKVTHLIAKVRPVLLWVDQNRWYQSMAFGIPLSTSRYYSDSHNQAIEISSCVFFDKKYEKPMRAAICQATRADGCVFNNRGRVGQITDSVVKQQIENKLFSWLFP